jgi:hypothetical protein
MAQAASRRTYTPEASVRSGSIYVEFVVNDVILAQVLLRAPGFSPVNIIPPWLFILRYHLGDKQQARC